MARPTDPEKLAALRARQAVNSRAYRARQAALRAAEPPKPKPPRQAPSTEAAVQRAHDARTAAKNRRNEIIGKFTSARNPRVQIYTPREVPTAPATIPETPARRRQRIKVLRENTEAQRLQNVGRRRKAEIGDFEHYDPRAETIMANLESQGGSEYVSRFRAATRKLASVSQQTLAILLQYEGGEGDFQSALTQIAYPKSSDVEDALGRIEVLAETAERAEGLYGPKAVGRLRI